MLVLFLISFCLAGALEGVISCPPPFIPEHGQVSLYQDGNAAKYVCELGYKLLGKEIVQCVDGVWDGESPTCQKIEENLREEPVPPPLPPSRLRSSWDEEEQQANSVDEMPMGDDSRVVFHPKRLAPTKTRKNQLAEINSISKLKKEARKEKNIELEGKADTQQKTENKTASMDNDEAMQNDKGEDQLRQMYWWAHYNHYNYPTSSALVEYASGYPGVMSLTDSQIAWINSLPADMREQYLRNYYVVRAGGSVDGARVEALRHYQDMYNYYNYYAPYYHYTRQPVSAAVEDSTIYDYSCNQAGDYFVKAPKLPNAYVSRYDARQNSRRSHYLAAVYRCASGYIMLDNRFTELYCSRRGWVGTQPVCVRRS